MELPKNDLRHTYFFPFLVGFGGLSARNEWLDSSTVYWTDKKNTLQVLKNIHIPSS